MDRRTTPALLTALLLSLGAAACSDDAPADRSALPSPSASPSPSVAAPTPTAPPTPTTPTAPATAAAGAEGGVVLGGTDLGVTRLGRPMDEAVRAVSVVLGAPDEDPAATTRCIESDREVRWGDLVLAARDGRLAGWLSRSRTLQTPSGVTVGTTLSVLRQVYGQGLQTYAANPDNPPSFAVDGVDVRGALSSAGDDAVVTVLLTSFCSGP